MMRLVFTRQPTHKEFAAVIEGVCGTARSSWFRTAFIVGLEIPVRFMGIFGINTLASVDAAEGEMVMLGLRDVPILADGIYLPVLR